MDKTPPPESPVEFFDAPGEGKTLEPPRPPLPPAQPFPPIYPGVTLSDVPPTLGRIVLFKAPANEGGETYAAIVTQVWEEGRVDLATFGPSSLYFQHDVPHHRGAQPGGPSWSWPPRIG
jgi:hypothetical protein